MSLTYSDYYANKIKEYENFIQDHRPEEFEHKGEKWSYIRSGSGKLTLIMFHGFGGNADTLYRFIGPLEKDYKIIAVSIPIIHRLDVLGAINEAIGIILEREKCQKFVLWGISMGGMIAQAILHRRKEQCQGLILCDSYAPNPSQGQKSDRRVKFVSALPWFISKFLFKAALFQLMKVAGPLDEMQKMQLRFIQERFKELFQALSRDLVMSHSAVVSQFLGQEHYTQESLANWEGSILILKSLDDPSYREIKEKDLLEKIYPSAKIIKNQGYGHIGALLIQEKYLAAFREMLSQLQSHALLDKP